MPSAVPSRSNRGRPRRWWPPATRWSWPATFSPPWRPKCGDRGSGCADSVHEIRAQAEILLSDAARLAARLTARIDRAETSVDQVCVPALRRASVTCLGRWREHPETWGHEMAVAVASDWVENLAGLLADLDGPATAAVATAPVSWWR